MPKARMSLIPVGLLMGTRDAYIITSMLLMTSKSGERYSISCMSGLSSNPGKI